MDKSIFIADINKMEHFNIFSRNIIDKLRNSGYRGTVLLDNNGIVQDCNGNISYLTVDEAMKTCDRSLIWLGGPIIADEDINKAIIYALTNDKVRVGLWPYAMSNEKLVRGLNSVASSPIATDNNELVSLALDGLYSEKENNYQNSI